MNMLRILIGVAIVIFINWIVMHFILFIVKKVTGKPITYYELQDNIASFSIFKFVENKLKKKAQ